MPKKNKRKKHYVLENEPSAYDEAILSWIAPEAIRHERGRIWKVFMGLLLVVSVSWGIVYDAWTFSLAVAVFAVVYYLIHLEHPKDVEIKISQMGIKAGARKYAYGKIKAFWIIYDPPYVETLNIRVRGEINGDITIQLNHQNPAPVRQILLEKISELEGQTEKLSDIILRVFKI